jgi:murein DD-endopeptidase MepM/ murein hydrolase activator NlpD
VQWCQRRAVSVIAAALGMGLALGACSSPADTDSVASGNDLPWVDGSPATTPPESPAAVPTPTPKAKATTAKPTKTPPATGGKHTYTFPVVGKSSYAHSHHDYPASDIITNCGNKVVAVTAGTILDVTKVDRWKASVNAGATRGGLSVSLLGDDGVRYYGSHMSVINANIVRGARVTTGQALGKIGDTGDASACHLHFGISPPCAKVGDWYTQRGAIYPWPYLDAWRKGTSKSAVAAVNAWKAQHGCPKKPLTDP